MMSTAPLPLRLCSFCLPAQASSKQRCKIKMGLQGVRSRWECFFACNFEWKVQRSAATFSAWRTPTCGTTAVSVWRPTCEITPSTTSQNNHLLEQQLHSMKMGEGRGSNNESREPAEGELGSQAVLESIDRQMQRLQIGSGACNHGLIFPFHASSECAEFVTAFNAHFSAAQGPISDCFQAAIFASRKSHPGVWNDITKMEWILSAFVASATQLLLTGNIADVAAAGAHVSFASFFEQWIALKLHKNQYAIDWNLICNLFYADEQTLRGYLRERCTSCLCLGVDVGSSAVTASGENNIGMMTS